MAKGLRRSAPDASAAGLRPGIACDGRETTQQEDDTVKDYGLRQIKCEAQESERERHIRLTSLMAAFQRAGYTRGQAATMAEAHMRGLPILAGHNNGPPLDA